MDQIQFQLEMLSYDEKVALAELEASKAQERVKELIYQKARFNMEWMRLVAKAQEEQKARQAAIANMVQPPIPVLQSPVSCNCGPTDKCEKCSK